MPADRAIDADEMAEAARGPASSLPCLALQAQASGLRLVPEHLKKALRPAERVAAARAVPPAR